MKKLLFIAITWAITQSAVSQPWMKYISEQQRKEANYNFYDLQKAFDEYWQNNKQERSSGIKPFRRWEEFMEPRVYPSGKLPAGQLYSVYKEQIRRNTKSTAQWTHIGPNYAPTGFTNTTPVGVGRINTIAFHPTNSDIIWIGAPSGGFWKTTDGGLNWYQTTDSLPVLGISDIAVDPTNPDIIYVSTGDSDGGSTYSIGLLKSEDGGETWNTTGLSYNIEDFVLARGILINPDTPQNIIVCAYSGIYKSTDAGANFTKVFESGGDRFVDIEYKPGDYNVIYASTRGYDSGGIFKSTDGGNNFTKMENGLPNTDYSRIELAVTPDNDQVVMALIASSNRSLRGVYKSTDEGETWTRTLSGYDFNLLGWSVTGDDGGGQGTYDLSLAISPVNENEIYVGGVNVWKSTDGGYSWNINAHWSGDNNVEYMHADQHILTYSPNGVLFCANDGGIYKTIDGDNWQDISNGINILQIYRLSTSTQDETMAMTGAQDNGTYLTRNGNWNAVVGGDGMECLIDYENDSILYGTAQYGALFKSEDAGYSFSYISPSTNGAWITPYVIDPTDHNILYAGYESIYKTYDRGEHWTTISGAIFGYNVTSLAVAPSNPDYIYASSYYSLYMTTNGGDNWVNLYDNLPYQGSITYIAISQNDPQTVWLTLSGFMDGIKVFKSTNGGISWINYSDGLPNLPTNCIVYQNNSNDLLYVGTDLGVYYRDNNMSEWLPFNDGLPNVIVRELEIHYATQRLRAATYGRGLWESPLHDYGNLAPVPSFEASNNIACGAQVIRFSDQSSYHPTQWEWTFEPNSITFENGTSASTQNPEVIFLSEGMYTVNLTVSNANGSNTIVKENIVKQTNVEADFVSDVNLTYPGGTVKFYDKSFCSPDTWQWSFSPATFSFIEGTNENSPNPVVQFQEIGDYSVTLTVTNSLGTNQLTKTDYISVGYNYFMNNSEITTCEGFFYDSKGPDNNYEDSENYTMTFIPNANEAKMIVDFTEFKVEFEPNCDYDYLEVFNGMSTESELIGKYCGDNSPGKVISTDESGALTFKFYSDGGVTDLGWIASINCTSTSVQSSDNYASILVYPNPANEQVNINVDGFKSNTLEVMITGIDGKIYFNRSTKLINQNYKTSIDINALSEGMYFIEIKAGNKLYKEKIIKN